jgi:hypothetical protein
MGCDFMIMMELVGHDIHDSEARYDIDDLTSMEFGHDEIHLRKHSYT